MCVCVCGKNARMEKKRPSLWLGLESDLLGTIIMPFGAYHCMGILARVGVVVLYCSLIRNYRLGWLTL
jgi:hypothetical protein